MATNMKEMVFKTMANSQKSVTGRRNAVSSYPQRAHNPEIPMILYLQDWAVKHENKQIVFDTNGKKILPVA